MYAIDPYDDDRRLLNHGPEPFKALLEKEARDLSEGRQYLGDSDFALILEYKDPKGGLPIQHRKYACVDAGNTALNIFYFLQKQAELPREAAKLAAQNLREAAEQFDVPVPDLLNKLAGDRRPETFTNCYEVVAASPPVRFEEELNKRATADGYDLLQMWKFNRHLLSPWEKRAFAKRICEEGLTNAPLTIKKYAGEGYAPDVDYAVNLRLVSLKPDGDTEKAYKKMAQQALNYELLMSEQKDLPPEVFALRLESLDKQAGLDKEASIPDAVYSTFGPTMVKAAEETVYERQGHQVTVTALESLALRGRQLVVKQFGEDFADKFRSDPVSIFKSLPDPEKLVMARMASPFNDDRPIG